jgi:hypothetical protein
MGAEAWKVQEEFALGVYAMFDWLMEEARAVKTRKFYVLDGPASVELRRSLEQSEIRFPRSYKEFVLQFGNAKLYRELSYYIVGVSAHPTEARTADGEDLYCIGHYDSSDAFFKRALLNGVGEESPVFESHKGRLVSVADGFEEWLSKRCKAARRRYGKKEWAQVVAGPPSFTDHETKIIEARRQFKCRTMGIAPNRDLVLEVYNGSCMKLPFLSLDVRRKNSPWRGGIWLPVASIPPGQTAVLHHPGYKETVDPSELDVFVSADPEPEDRDRYWEFKPMQ